MFVANPNNPTGTHVGRAAVEKLLREVPADVIIVMDEAYLEYADAPDYPNSLTLRGLRERLLVLRTFSKIYGLAAFRVGYGIGPRKLIDYMNRVRAPFNVSTLAQAAAAAALDDVDHVETARALNQRERRRITDALTARGLAVAPSQANFILVDVKRPARAVYDALLQKGVIVRPFASLPTSLRVTAGYRARKRPLSWRAGRGAHVIGRSALLGLCALGLALAGCPKSEDVIVHTGQGKEKTAPQIDADPLALLPGGAITVGVLDAQALFASQFGDKLLEVAKRRAPVPDAAGFEPKRDISKLYFGVYSIAGRGQWRAWPSATSTLKKSRQRPTVCRRRRWVCPSPKRLTPVARCTRPTASVSPF